MGHMILVSYKDVPRSLSLSKNLFISSFFLVYLIRCRTSKNGYVTGENIANIKWESRMQFLGESLYDWKKLTQKRFTLPSFLKIVMKTCTRFIWLHRCWWRMLETKYVGDFNFKIMVMVLAFLVTNIHYLFTLASGTKIQKMSPTLSHQHNDVTNITVTMKPFLDKENMWKSLRIRSLPKLDCPMKY